MSTCKTHRTVQQLTRELERAYARLEAARSAPQSDDFLDIVRIAHSADPDGTEYHLHKLGLRHIVANLRVEREVEIEVALREHARSQSAFPFA